MGPHSAGAAAHHQGRPTANRVAQWRFERMSMEASAMQPKLIAMRRIVSATSYYLVNSA